MWRLTGPPGLAQVRGNLRAPRDQVFTLVSDGVRRLFGADHARGRLWPCWNTYDLVPDDKQGAWRMQATAATHMPCNLGAVSCSNRDVHGQNPRSFM